ncbi:MAG: hypothetical protein IT582_06875 [Opitutaceae bacterium]|nr:hypothetical protein [Opitutaceae bacterium]
MKLLSALVFLTGIAPAVYASTSLPLEAAQIKLTAVRSPTVLVFQPVILSKEGQLTITGSVYKRAGAPSVASTHLDVVFLDSSQRQLRTETTHFSPRLVPGRGRYSVPLENLPSETATIQVRAHTGRHIDA